MKKQTAWVVAAALGIQLALTAFPAAMTGNAAEASNLQVNGQAAALEKGIVLRDGRTFVGAQDAARLLHAEWTQTGNTGTLKLREDRILTFQLDTGAVQVNGEAVENGEAALLTNQEVYLPLRWITEEAGHEIVWNAEEKSVEIVVTQKEGGLTVLTPDQLTAEEQAFVQSVYQKRGVHQQGDLFVIARGESANPGYGVKVTGTEWSWEQLIVDVKWTEPDPDMMYAQVITYPYVVVRAELPPYTTVLFRDADTKKPLFETGE
ncbi:stalk domain-containing protein [Brevibacillus sp. TJ4]|uniref:stalk domain-containing protein n=1 Tax=Brevibacillus sp. TJ4 TaxID=3234853 RepID=UPI0037D884E9